MYLRFVSYPRIVYTRESIHVDPTYPKPCPPILSYPSHKLLNLVLSPTHPKISQKSVNVNTDIMTLLHYVMVPNGFSDSFRVFKPILNIFDIFEFCHTRGRDQNITGTWANFSSKSFENRKMSKLPKILENHQRSSYKLEMLVPLTTLRHDPPMVSMVVMMCLHRFRAFLTFLSFVTPVHGTKISLVLERIFLQNLSKIEKCQNDQKSSKMTKNQVTS